MPHRTILTRRMAALTAFSLAILAAACSTSPSPETSAPPATEPTPDASPPATPNPIRALPAGWTEVTPGGRTACSDGSPFRFYVRPGTVDRVVFEMSGGGACWDSLTCGFASQLFSKNVDPAKLPWVVPGGTRPPGIYDHEAADNPFRDWHHVFVPYCTGDVHWGDNLAKYTDSLTIAHVGAVNARAALDWLYGNVPRTEKVMVTGCSAGGYGAIMWAPYVRQHYGTSAAVYQLADSAAGTITPDFFSKIRDSWRFGAALPAFVPGLSKPDDVTSLSALYGAIGRFYPDVPLAQYNTTYDETQSYFFTALGGGDVKAWSTAMRAEVSGIVASTPSFRAITAPGYQHCILNRPDLYTATFDGERLVDWISRRIDDKPVTNHDCGENCGAPKPN